LVDDTKWINLYIERNPVFSHVSDGYKEWEQKEHGEGKWIVKITDLLSDYNDEKIICWNVANGDYFAFKNLWEATDLKEVHRLNAMKLAVETEKSLEQKEVVRATKQGKDIFK